MAALGVLALLAGCLKDDTSGSSSTTGLGSSTPLPWTSTSSSPSTGNSGDTPLLWVDAVAASGQNPFGIPSTDERTYGSPTVYVANSIHPLMTRTTSNIITTAEDHVASRINNYRWLAITGGNFFINPPVPVGVFYLPMSLNLRKNARAHCKHFVGFHNGPLTLSNPEGDTVTGRLTKSMITYGAAAEVVLSGPTNGDPDLAADLLIQNYGSLFANPAYNYIGVGHFAGGTETFYWSVILAASPSPVQ
ncbi:MAG TPA: hypothetical protein VF950_10425 [Planctomycetota bacterium]